MSFMLTRMFAYITLAAYLVVGGVAVRFAMPVMQTVSISGQYLNLFSETSLKANEEIALTTPEMHFAEINFPVVKKEIVVKAPVVKPTVVAVQKPAVLKLEKVAKNELPFYEPVKLQAIVMNPSLQTNLVALFKELSPEMVAQSAAPVMDEVSTIQATDAEPTFFEYQETEKVAAAPAPKSNVEITPKAEVANNVDTIQNVDNSSEEVAVDDLVAFDYSKATEDIKTQAMPMVSTVTTQPASNTAAPVVTPKTSKSTKVPEMKEEASAQEKNAFMAPAGHPSKMTIQLVGTNLVTTQPAVGFEVRFQDDLGDAIQDYNNGEVIIQNELAEARMNRSITVLKRGFAPTNTDLIVEEGVAQVSIPALEEEKFNKLLAPYESRGPIGAVLVELDDEVEGASLDVPFSEVLALDGDLKVTKGSDFRYQLFVGVKAGNALLSYKDMKGEVTSKIIHIHERELTFDANFFETVENEIVKLYEEDLLGKEKTPLIISSEQVKQFASNKVGRKLNNHTYKMDFARTTLGGRQYLELTHQSEPVFVGVKENSNVEVPSENFMRYILSRFEGAKLGNRCMVQVNLSKKAVKVDVAAESVGQSLMTYTQVLDTDGKFYDTLGEKSRKIIIVGENQGAAEFGLDGRINLKITYQDGSVQFLGSYCSPNTYLVEQL